MGGTSIRQMVVAFCFCYLICMNGAIPVTRSSNLLQKPQTYNTNEQLAEGVLLMEIPDQTMVENRSRRMEIELSDYPGSGANNRHTPRPPQLGRGCIDC